MVNRALLHISKLQAFKDWLDDQCIAYRPGKGTFQVLQVYVPEEKCGWQCIFSRLDMPEHYTVQNKLVPLVKEFNDDQKSGENNGF